MFPCLSLLKPPQPDPGNNKGKGCTTTMFPWLSLPQPPQPDTERTPMNVMYEYVPLSKFVCQPLNKLQNRSYG